MVLPLAGIVAAGLFYMRDERQTASTALACAALGVLLYLILFSF